MMYDSSVYVGHPEEQAMYWQHQIADDNCAVAAELSLLHQYGVPLSQSEAIYVSASHGWYHPGGGGTCPQDVGNLMELYGVPTHTVTHASLADLAAELHQGHGVIVGVRSDQLWEQGPQNEFWNFIAAACGLDTSEFQPADHAVVVTGIDVSDPANPMIILNDSGDPKGCAHPYPLDRFMDAWENSDFYYTATETALPHGMERVNELEILKQKMQGVVASCVYINSDDPGKAVAMAQLTGVLFDAFFADDMNIAML